MKAITTRFISTRFTSHFSKEEAHVQVLHETLSSNGELCWIDRRCTPTALERPEVICGWSDPDLMQRVPNRAFRTITPGSKNMICIARLAFAERLQKTSFPSKVAGLRRPRYHNFREKRSHTNSRCWNPPCSADSARSPRECSIPHRATKCALTCQSTPAAPNLAQSPPLCSLHSAKSRLDPLESLDRTNNYHQRHPCSRCSFRPLLRHLRRK